MRNVFASNYHIYILTILALSLLISILFSSHKFIFLLLSFFRYPFTSVKVRARLRNRDVKRRKCYVIKQRCVVSRRFDVKFLEYFSQKNNGKVYF